jgi:Domain of unknown function (DUF3597)
MSIFGKIKSAIFGSAKAADAPAGGAAASVAAGQQQSAAAGAVSQAPGSTPISIVDVEAVLTKLSASNSQKLDWRKSIVDLMKLLDLDSGLAARKELAQELKYTGDTNDSASMNIWLHKQVMQKLAESGGKVPDSLKH